MSQSPLNIDALVRRRKLLGMTQADLAVTAGISPSTVLRIETRQIPKEGGNTGVDLFMRLCAALRMEYTDLLIQPQGNRYQRAVQFAAYQHDPSAAPKLHDKGRSVLAENYRELTGKTRGIALPPLPQEDQNGVVPDPTSPTPSPEYDFTPDPSTE